MVIKHILHYILLYFLPVAAPATAALLAIGSIRRRWKWIVFGNVLFLIFIMTYSIVTCPVANPLLAEWAFYTLELKPDGTYAMRSLLCQGDPAFLGVREDVMKELPIAHSGDQTQMRFRLNRQAYVYVFHFDTTFSKARQLFPTEDAKISNPMPSDVWVEIPSSKGVWTFDQNPGIEGFVAFVSTKKPTNIQDKVKEIIEEARTAHADTVLLQNVCQRLTDLAPCDPGIRGVYTPESAGIVTYRYQSQDGQSALLYQFIRHEP